MSEAPPATEVLLEAAVRRRYGANARIAALSRPTLGGVNLTCIFDVVHGDAIRRVVSRQETYDGTDSPFLSTAAQFRVMRIAHEHGVPVPEPLFEFDAADGLGHGYVTAFVAGETQPRRLLREASFAEARARLPAQAGEALARLHSIEPRSVQFLEQRAESRDPLVAERARLDSFAEAHPAIELGLRWLERHRPAAAPRVLVHGDFRTGNLMIDADGLRAVLDWECCHLGSAAADLGYFCTRSWRFGAVEQRAGGFGALEPLLEAYVAAGGRRIDSDEVRYWEIYGLVRWAILNIWQAWGHVCRGRRGIDYAVMGRNTSLVEYDLLLTLQGRYR